MEPEPSDSLSDQTHSTLMVALTVILGNAQLLRRRLTRDEVVDPELMMRSLQAIERASNGAIHTVRSAGSDRRRGG
jgi:hypothetical protein